jgi:hypothetical protein
MARPLLPLLAALALAIGVAPALAKTDPVATVTDEDTKSLPDKIRDKLSADGYKDITVMPTSYAVSATDKEGKPVLLLIGPNSASTLQQAPEQAQSPPGKDEFIQQ